MSMRAASRSRSRGDSSAAKSCVAMVEIDAGAVADRQRALGRLDQRMGVVEAVDARATPSRS